MRDWLITYAPLVAVFGCLALLMIRQGLLVGRDLLNFWDEKPSRSRSTYWCGHNDTDQARRERDAA